MSFKLAMNQKTILSCDDQLPPGVSIHRSNRLSTKSAYLDTKTITSHYDSKSGLVFSDILSQNQKSVCQNLHPSNIFLLRACARQVRHKKALELRLRNHGRGSLINIM
jgi:hypothetical protein